jgi:hypothetical protein
MDDTQMAAKKFSASFKEIGEFFHEAAVGGIFFFDNVSYDDFIKFMNAYSKLKVIQIGVRDPAFVEELERLSALAFSTHAR